MVGCDVRYRNDVRGCRAWIGVLALVIGAALVVPTGAFAASATITSVVPIATGGLSVATNVEIDQSDCTAYGYCSSFLELNTAPSGQSCTTYNPNQIAEVGPSFDGPGTTPVTLTASIYTYALSYQICEFAFLPDLTYHYLASTTYSPPVTTGSISVASEAGGVLGGTVSVDEPFCGFATDCLLFAQVYEQDGSGSCAATPAGKLIYSVPGAAGTGAGSWPYSFTPSVSAGSVQVCAYNFLGGSLIANGTYTFPPPPTVTVKNTPVSVPTAKLTLTVATARATLRRGLLKRFSNTTKLALSCRSLSHVKVRCSSSFERPGYTYRGSATASLSGKVIHTSWTLKRTKTKSSVPTMTSTTTPTKTTTTPTPASCTPLSDEGTCYEPGEYCRATDHERSCR
jgi:hypothetical protein